VYSLASRARRPLLEQLERIARFASGGAQNRLSVNQAERFEFTDIIFALRCINAREGGPRPTHASDRDFGATPPISAAFRRFSANFPAFCSNSS